MSRKITRKNIKDTLPQDVVAIIVDENEKIYDSTYNIATAISIVAEGYGRGIAINRGEYSSIAAAQHALDFELELYKDCYEA